MLRAVLAGCGAMSKGWLQAIVETPDLANRIEIVGLVDIDCERAKALRDAFALKSVEVGTDLDAMLAGLKPDLLFDVVVPSARRHVVEAGLRHGCHVLSEKPMAASLPEARELLALAEKSGRVHAVVQNRRFIPGVRRMRRLVESGALGELTSVHCDFFLGPHFGGFREEMKHVLLLDMAIHTFDAARYVIGTKPMAVYCHETNPKGSWYAHGAAANAIFEFAEGVTFTYRGSWCAEGANTSWESSWRLIGTRGTLLWDGADRFEANVVASDEGFFRDVEAIEVPQPVNVYETRGHASVIAEFVNAIEEGRAPETVSTDNIKSLAMVFGAISSVEEQRRIELTV